MPHDGPAAPYRVRVPRTGQLLESPQAAGENPEAWLRAIASGLSGAGFTARVDEPPAVPAVIVTALPPSGREAVIILDEAGYAELRWWPGPDPTPAEVADVIARVLAVIAASPPARPRGRQRGSSQ